MKHRQHTNYIWSNEQVNYQRP